VKTWDRFKRRPNSLIELLVFVWLVSHVLHALFLAAELYVEVEGPEKFNYWTAFAIWLGSKVFENYASEGFQVAVLAWGLKNLRHVGNPEGKDSERETSEKLDRIEREVTK